MSPRPADDPAAPSPEATTAVPADPRPAPCPACGTRPQPEDRFCEECGQRLLPPDTTAGDEQSADAAAAETDEASARCAHCAGGSIDMDGYCDTCGRREAAATDHIVIDLAETGAGVSDRGKRHHRNEDAMALAAHTDPSGAPALVAVVCDGVSSSYEPQRASAAAAEAAAQALGEAVTAGEPASFDAVRATLDAVTAAAERIAAVTAELAEAEPGLVAAAPPGCTYATALTTRQTVTVGWIGDSRAYWLAAEPDATASALLTADDSWAVEAIAEGLLPEAEAFADPRAHTITRWLGTDYAPAEPHVTGIEPHGRGSVLLCTDGLWNYVDDPDELAGIVARAGSPREAADALVSLALDAGGHDNVTVVLLPFPPEPPK